MAAFGNMSWAQNYGPVAYIRKDSVTAITGTGVTEGTNQLTYACDATGLYRISANITVRTSGTGAGQVVNPQIVYNNGTAIAAGNITMNKVATGTLDLTAAAGTSFNAEGLYKCVSGTNVVVSLLGAGTFTTAAIIDVDIVIQRV